MCISLYANAQDIDDGMSIEEHLSLPAIKSSSVSSSIIRHFETLQKTFKKIGYETRATRKGEVLCVTIPADKLFGANSTTLLSTAKNYLDIFKQLVVRPELYKLLILVHTDNTGDEQYSDFLSDSRADAVNEYFETFTPNDINVYSFGMGFDEPRMKDNNSLENRRKNRRVEIYIIPTQRLIDQAKSGHLT